MTLEALLQNLIADKNIKVYFHGSAIYDFHKSRYDGNKGIHREFSNNEIVQVHKAHTVKTINIESETVTLINKDGYEFVNIPIESLTFDNRHELDKFYVVSYPMKGDKFIKFKDVYYDQPTTVISKQLLKTAKEALELVGNNSIIIPEFILNFGNEIPQQIEVTQEVIDKLNLHKPVYQQMISKASREMFGDLDKEVFKKFKEIHGFPK